VLLSFDLPPDVTAVQIPAGLTHSGERTKVEVLTREASGNQTAIETCFEVE
jgi:multidrug efflux pump subunit AcrA (membrane-fusion protein)